jgi:hypothetical protein
VVANMPKPPPDHAESFAVSASAICTSATATRSSAGSGTSRAANACTVIAGA